MKKDAAITLFSNKFLGNTSPEIIKLIDNISTLESINKKEHLFFEGDKGESFYFLVSGKVKLYKISSAGKEVVVKIINPGEIFAEVTIIDPYFPVNAIALEEILVLKINGKKFLDILSERENLNKKFVFLLIQRIKTLLSRLEMAGTESVEERLLHYLKDIAEKKGSEFTLPISKGELASLLFTSPETISRTFARLKDKGIIEVHGKKIIVKKFTDF
ncbi:CRP/FNR family transcriptional regulator, anaerobic regulatory protein [Thermotomaculum hydrothermale]|uniref:CRP/FNR family transcriptional regulator, anaerobic regulatory protein n=1 Tax=Thermotomaculum hydrothermale TaxID=981385 RepID=A0A7R6SY44_9BACT|nr:Crp/Fnr family transcriptional regulator [Thermotomaculum hydrothermale]BBB32245.1 CRP/FNR family transcriptional regulator, anaerobic regulatory protein [Thermotomaculum hydrothermale]